MNQIDRLETFEQLKTLADARRMEILRLLMASPATLTHLAGTLGQSPAWIRHHILALESANLVELAEVRKTRGVTEKYYRARAAAFLIQEMLLPESDQPVIVLSGSHDLALELLASHIHSINVLTLPVGSLDGLVALRQGLCHMAGTHLLDTSGEYNIPFIRHIFPDRETILLTLAYRDQGLLLAPGNPKQIRSLADLARADVTFINRNKGSGTRLWLDRQLEQAGIPVEQIKGYSREVRTHTESAQTVQEGRADVTLGLRAAAIQHDLDFIPLFQERYDLAMSPETASQAGFQSLFDTLQSAAFRRQVAGLGGYDTSHTGNEIPVFQ
jgi:putative molybdopterin biosynthesis protein